MLYLNDHLQDLDLDNALSQLSDQRREQALRYKHDLGQRTCAAAYLLLCQGLRAEYGITDKPVFAYGEHGKPFIVGHPEIHFNFSHCREAVVCFVSDRPVGIDVESKRSFSDSLISYTMNAREEALIRASDNPPLEFIRLWTRKEAVVKLTGDGIKNNMREILERDDVHIQTVVSDDSRYVYSVCEFLR